MCMSDIDSMLLLYISYLFSFSFSRIHVTLLNSTYLTGLILFHFFHGKDFWENAVLLITDFNLQIC